MHMVIGDHLLLLCVQFGLVKKMSRRHSVTHGCSGETGTVSEV